MCACKRRAACRPTCSSRSTPTPSSNRPRAAPPSSAFPKRRDLEHRELAGEKGNDADLIGGVNLGTQDKDLARVLLDLSTTAQINDSLKLGRAVLGELGSINDLHKGAVEQAGFAVLKAPDIPSILVETAFISNPDEEARLRDEAYQEKLANSILRGIKAYFSRNPPLAKSKMPPSTSTTFTPLKTRASRPSLEHVSDAINRSARRFGTQSTRCRIS